MNDGATEFGATSLRTREIRVPYDKEIVFLVPVSELGKEPELSIVIPAMNEELSIAEFIDWCHAGITNSEVAAELIIVDSSTDLTANIALGKGACVLKSPKRGLGRAYIDAIPFVRGRFVLMGDADCTYDFRHLQHFMERFRQGYEFIMGSRFSGSIEAGAMPALHRYFGTPLTGAILNLIYGTNFSDIHCGMRGLTLSALKAMNLQSQSWEYASEMIVKSVRLGLRSTEIPIDFYRGREGRLSHHRRNGWFSPWAAGWVNLKSMLVGAADFFLITPGLLLFGIGLLLLLALVGGPIRIGNITLSLNTMLLGVTLSVVGLQAYLLGGIARCLYDLLGHHRRRWMEAFAYTRTMMISGLMFVSGLWLTGDFVGRYVSAGYVVLPGLVPYNHRAVFGLFLVIVAFQTFVFTLLVHGVSGFAPLPSVQGFSGRLDRRAWEEGAECQR